MKDRTTADERIVADLRVDRVTDHPRRVVPRREK